MKNLVFCLFVFCICSVYSQTKYALLIGVGNYPEEGGWPDLSSKNDIDLVQQMLLEQSFDKSRIEILFDKTATVTNVLKSFESLLNKVQKGDIVYIHYSGHGQQIADLDKTDYPKLSFIEKDESDGWDEALALYNAPMEYFNGYNFSEHLIDDQIDYYVSNIDKKIGEKGHLVFVLDACHTGTATRGNEPTKKRGSSDKCSPPNYRPVKSMDNKNQETRNASTGVTSVFSGCKDDEVNFETKVEGKGYGSLTYSIVQAITNLKSEASYSKVFDIVYGNLLIISDGRQNAQSKFDNPDDLFFGGKTVPKPDYFTLYKYDASNKIVYLKAGKMNEISVGDSMSFYPLNSNTKNTIASAKGIVSKLKGTTCEVTLIDFLPVRKISEFASYKAIRHHEVMSGQSLKLAFIKGTSNETIKLVKNIVKDQKNIKIVDEAIDLPNYYIREQSPQNVIIEIPFSGNPLRQMRNLNLTKKSECDTLLKFLKDALKIDYFINLSLTDKLIDLNVKLIKMNDSTLNSYKSKPKYQDLNDIKNLIGFDVELQNLSGDATIFVHAVHISNNKIIQELKLSQRDNNFLEMYAGQKLDTKKYIEPIFLSCTENIDCGFDRIYFFASYEKMDFSVVEELSKSLGGTRGGDDAFAKLISDGSEGINHDIDAESGVRIYKFEFNVTP